MPDMRSSYLGMVLVVLFWGGNFTMSKLAFPTLPPLAFTAIRFGIGSTVMWFLLGRLEPGVSTPRALWRPMLLLGLVGNTAYQLLFSVGLSRTSATNTSLLLAAMPTVVTVAAGVMGLEKISVRQGWALVLATAGVVTVIAARGLDLSHGDWVGDFLILASVLCWAGYTIGLRRLGTRVSALRVTAMAMITGTPGLILAGIPELRRVDWSRVGWLGWGGLAYSTGLSLLAAYVLWSYAVQRAGAARASLFTCATPLAATIIAMLVLHEQPTMAHVLGGGLIIGGVVLGNVR